LRQSYDAALVFPLLVLFGLFAFLLYGLPLVGMPPLHVPLLLKSVDEVGLAASPESELVKVWAFRHIGMQHTLDGASDG